MTLTIELDPQLERRLQVEAAKSGVEPKEFVRQVLDNALPLPTGSQAASLQELFNNWAADDATDDPEEIARREQECEEFKRNLNESRRVAGESRTPFP
jgi:hypothetical protein